MHNLQKKDMEIPRGFTHIFQRKFSQLLYNSEQLKKENTKQNMTSCLLILKQEFLISYTIFIIFNPFRKN